MICECKICGRNFENKEVKRTVGDVLWSERYCSAECFTKAFIKGEERLCKTIAESKGGNMEKLTVEFKYGIGEVVLLQLSLDKAQIIEQCMNKCSGGPQLWYKVRVGNYRSEYDKLSFVHEVELRPVEREQMDSPKKDIRKEPGKNENKD